MKLTRATHLLAGLLVAISHHALMAQDKSLSRVLFENADFKVFAVRDPEVLPLISEPARFGVFLLRDQYAPLLRGTHLSFLGSSGQRSLLVYGTPAGVIPFIDKASFLSAGADLVWVVPKFEAEITEPVFRKNLPDSFTSLVRDDVFSIGALADRAAVGKQPSEQELARARAAINDLSFKSRWFSFYSDPESAPQQVYVKVRTLKQGQEIQDWTVWCVPLGWEDDKAHAKEFDKHSSPTYKWMSPGEYKMWASRGGKIGVVKQVAVGDSPGTTKELDLEVP
jgi:hypothetical protein